MSVFIIRRLLQSVLVILAMSVIVFAGVFVIGDPIEILISPEADQAAREAAIHALGLDKPPWQQYLIFLANAVQGDLGRSFIYAEPALQLILHRMPATLELAFAAMLLAIVFELGRASCWERVCQYVSFSVVAG